MKSDKISQMDMLVSWISAHAQQSHWLLFGLILLAGVNVPISVDVLVVFAGFLAAVVVPERFWHIYFSIFLGCYLSAMVSYWFGRFMGEKLLRRAWFARLVSAERLRKMGEFYVRFGFWALLMGRFIPFGVRNCLFMSSGMSRLSFVKFIVWDFVACLAWSSFIFYFFYSAGNNYDILLGHLKEINLIFLGVFSVTLIVFFWYKWRKKNTMENESIQ